MTRLIVAAADPSGASNTTAAPCVVHIVVKSGADAKNTFSYFPYPIPPIQQRLSSGSTTGLYRLSVDPDGKVTKIQILKRMGAAWDVLALKTFVTWRAKPGPPRLVDVGWSFVSTQPAYRPGEATHIPR